MATIEDFEHQYEALLTADVDSDEFRAARAFMSEWHDNLERQSLDGKEGTNGSGRDTSVDPGGTGSGDSTAAAEEGAVGAAEAGTGEGVGVGEVRADAGGQVPAVGGSGATGSDQAGA